ncbi:recombination-associated protein RdgC [Desulfatirhabdium butyrativorans]|uniref:recombination-associated protein RdgC n=1 Tax=Desulfatirhabdium butyrativorans TaxID=340467 RepID=UPI0004064EB6|nr:recombination-associated protein RdgC [Desulfatirhabdium butyrativorans]
MGLVTSNMAITTYRVESEPKESIIDAVYQGLSKYTILDIDGESIDKSIGWTSLDKPLDPDFSGSSFLVGSLFVFALRIDKKVLSPKVIAKQFQKEMSRKLKESGREYLNKGEKKAVKDAVIADLNRRIPATPRTVDVIWNYEANLVYFFSNQKTANEEFETLFTKSFEMNLIQMFPYTVAMLLGDLNPMETDRLHSLTPVSFVM